jgi:hypothetical protein
MAVGLVTSMTPYRPSFCGLGMCPVKEIRMNPVIELVAEMEAFLDEQSGQIDVNVRAELQIKLDELTRQIEEADESESKRTSVEVLNLFASMLNAITNVMTILK